MLLARGTVQDRPFGKTVGTIARRGVTGQLTAEDGYALVFDHGQIVAASSPLVEDTAPAIALANDIVNPSQVAIVERWLDAVPDADALEVLATVALMTREEVHALRRRVIAQRAARVIALQRGDFVLTSTIALAVKRDCQMHAGAVIYQAARHFIAEPRLRALVGELGHRFELRAEAYGELASFGFGDAERAVLRALDDGVAVADIARRDTLAAVYALASCGALLGGYPRASSNSMRFARGTLRPGDDRTPSIEPIEVVPNHDAEAAFQRAQAALSETRVEEAVQDLEVATHLSPNEPRYFAALAWARFCHAPDKAQIADETRRMLGRAIACSESPVLPRYYLEMVELKLRGR
jgi:hypothetical protein